MKHTELPHTCNDEDFDDDCLACLAADPVQTVCPCAECCRSLVLEALVEGAQVEPKIAEQCSPLLDHPDKTGHREVVSYLLNSKDGPCTFLDTDTNLCRIYESRPLMCRLFNCDAGEDRLQLVELGILEPRDR